MPNNEIECPICKLGGGDVQTRPASGDNVAYDCKRCGSFRISRRAKVNLEHSDPPMTLSAWLRERQLSEIEIPLLTAALIDEILETLPKYGPIEKQNRLLRAIEAKTNYPGNEVILIPEHDYPLAWAENEKELEFYVGALVERALLAFPEKSMRTIHDPLYPMHITSDGWEHIEHLQSTPLEQKQVFVAMSFDSDLLPIYVKAIAPAIKVTGYLPYRVDSTPHLERIDAKIVAEIRRSRFMVADVTQQKAGVYYEAGFAQGLGIPVIWSVQRDDLKNVHFDTRQYNHIVWEAAADLQIQLENFILATIGAHAI